MSTIRQDAWSGDDDLILAEVVLRHIREGSTQLAAFQEVGERLSRTSAACGFRWNSTIRKKYESAISLAKKHRTTGKKEQGVSLTRTSDWNEEYSEEEIVTVKEVQSKPIEVSEKVETLTMERVLTFLEDYHEQSQHHLSLVEVDKLKSENEQLKQELETERKRNQVIAEDYQALVSIMDRARKMSLQNQASEM